MNIAYNMDCMHTSYFLIFPDGKETEFWRLKDTKAAVENIMKEMNTDK